MRATDKIESELDDAFEAELDDWLVAEESLTRISGRLTRREREVLALLAMGYNHREVADLLGIARISVTLCVRRIRGKADYLEIGGNQMD